MRRAAAWLAALAIGSMLALLVIPRLQHPALSPTDLQDVASAEKRIELKQAQDRLDNDARATLLQGIAGLLLVAGAIATWQQVLVSREGQITDRFARAIDHLGSGKPDVRLGGIYTLERIAKDSPPDRRTVAAVLAALVRIQAPWMVGAPEGPEHPSPTVDQRLPWLELRAVDVHTAMLVLGRRPPSRDPLQLYLSRVDLRAAFLPDARLPSTTMRHTNLARALMRHIDLENSDLEDTDLRQADLGGARLSNASLYKAHLQGADLRGADLRKTDLRGANFQGARLESADLRDARVDSTTVWPEGFQPP
jgi:hypothetical protein